jgi:acetyl esterase
MANSRFRQRLERGVVVALGRAPRRLQKAIAGAAPVSDGHALEPEIGAALRLLSWVPESDFDQLPLPQARAQVDYEARIFGGPPLPMSRVLGLSIPTPTGDIGGRLYVADERDTDRLLVYYHGGGFVVGGLDSADSACRFLAAHAGVAVLSVDYRLAPEHPFPAAPDDALAAFRFAVSVADDWGHDPMRIAVGGDSAGATLAAVVCQDLRLAAQTRPAFQLLFFPVTDLSTRHPSYDAFSEGYFLTGRQMDWYRNHYLGDHPADDVRVSPLLAPVLTGLPPAYVAVSGFDVLRDEGEAYAARLAAAGVPVALRRHSGLIHAFVNSTGVGHTGREAMLEACGALRVGVGAGVGRVEYSGP